MTEYKIIRSKRKSVSIEVNRQLEVIVRAPFFVSQGQIDKIVNSKRDWIDNAKKRVAIKTQNYTPPTKEQIEALRKSAEEYIPSRVEYFSDIMNLKPISVKITSAKTRFGSCSGKNRLCFSLYLMQKPLMAVDYVIVHELAHIKYKNHGKHFYLLIEKYMPDYKERNKLLKDSHHS